MTLATVMANLALGRSNKAVLEVVAHIADRLAASVIGLACYRPIEIVCRDLAVPATLFDEDRKQVARQTAVAEAEFRSALANVREGAEWRVRRTIVPLAEYVAGEARGVDLVVAGIEADEMPCDPTRQTDIRDLVMRVGRPLLLVPAGASDCRFDRLLVAWKDTREAQRAIADALPLLRMATKVDLVEIAGEPERGETQDRLAQVVAWLGRHGVMAEPKVVAPSGANAAQLDTIADQINADLIVAGAYGYSRQSAWVLGGVTSALLTSRRRCALLAH